MKKLELTIRIIALTFILPSIFLIKYQEVLKEEIKKNDNFNF